MAEDLRLSMVPIPPMFDAARHSNCSYGIAQHFIPPDTASCNCFIYRNGASRGTRTPDLVLTNFEVQVLDETGLSRLKSYNPL